MHGRISGSAAWRSQRGELGIRSHIFRFSRPGACAVRYSAVSDKYEIENGDQKELASWASGVHSAQQVFRKVESDWKMVYLAREESATSGSIAWMVEAASGHIFTELSVRALSATYEDGRVHWTVQLDEHEPTPVEVTERATEFGGQFSRALITARLAGGRGPTAWQHAQLFRAPLSSAAHTLHIHAVLQRLV